MAKSAVLSGMRDWTIRAAAAKGQGRNRIHLNEPRDEYRPLAAAWPLLSPESATSSNLLQEKKRLDIRPIPREVLLLWGDNAKFFARGA
jgi:hypothetical protein